MGLKSFTFDALSFLGFKQNKGIVEHIIENASLVELTDDFPKILLNNLLIVSEES